MSVIVVVCCCCFVVVCCCCCCCFVVVVLLLLCCCCVVVVLFVVCCLLCVVCCCCCCCCCCWCVCVLLLLLLLWMGDGRLVGKGLHHTSLHTPCAAHMLKLSIFLFVLSCAPPLEPMKSIFLLVLFLGRPSRVPAFCSVMFC